jgi:hypothetical protein
LKERLPRIATTRSPLGSRSRPRTPPIRATNASETSANADKLDASFARRSATRYRERARASGYSWTTLKTVRCTNLDGGVSCSQKQRTVSDNAPEWRTSIRSLSTWLLYLYYRTPYRARREWWTSNRVQLSRVAEPW